ncbi:hypothetical protein GUJ93_ZPchr0337g7073 [Zizania palustris]|uniref:Uncharacterized protein n=1 Tax=Zizania palustris TaxID=103762 RepID=A0A8J5RIL2_ZIZPA|nr:hypothetical protein GUJ93_ZPchr0337g7073 [Zizania palustris]
MVQARPLERVVATGHHLSRFAPPLAAGSATATRSTRRRLPEPNGASAGSVLRLLGLTELGGNKWRHLFDHAGLRVKISSIVALELLGRGWAGRVIQLVGSGAMQTV